MKIKIKANHKEGNIFEFETDNNSFCGKCRGVGSSKYKKYCKLFFWGLFIFFLLTLFFFNKEVVSANWNFNY